MEQSKKACLRCKKDIGEKDLHKIVIYVVQEKFTEHHYEHVECPDNFYNLKISLIDYPLYSYTL